MNDDGDAGTMSTGVPTPALSHEVTSDARRVALPAVHQPDEPVPTRGFTFPGLAEVQQRYDPCVVLLGDDGFPITPVAGPCETCQGGRSKELPPTWRCRWATQLATEEYEGWKGPTMKELFDRLMNDRRRGWVDL